jgi:hypothetical protein
VCTALDARVNQLINLNQHNLRIYIEDLQFLWSSTVLYTLSVKGNFVAYRQEPLLKLGVAWVRKFAEFSSSHGGEYDVQSCLLGYTAV